MFLILFYEGRNYKKTFLVINKNLKKYNNEMFFLKNMTNPNKPGTYWSSITVKTVNRETECLIMFINTEAQNALQCSYKTWCLLGLQSV